MDRSGCAAGRILSVVGLMLLLALTSGCGGPGPEDGTAATTTTQFVMPIADDACLSCHEDFLETRTGEDQKEFSHSLHARQRISCTTCHTAVGHGGLAIPGRESCDACHGIEMPHPQGFDTAHGKGVVEAGSDRVCRTCHNVYLHCQTCHGVQMPHPEDWTGKHGEIAYPRLQVCATCHEPSFCLSCHPVEMPHPADWTTTHGLPVLDKGSAMCTSCHEPDLCAACHGMPMPHPFDWGETHKDTARQKRDECVLCHAEKDCLVCHVIHQTHGRGGGS